MKQKDVMLIIVLSIFSAVISVIVSNFVIVPKKSFNQKAAVVDPITADFAELNKKYFNKDSIDPTKTIQIGDNSNSKIFDSKQ